jgi:hypothetical protein
VRQYKYGIVRRGKYMILIKTWCSYAADEHLYPALVGSVVWAKGKCTRVPYLCLYFFLSFFLSVSFFFASSLL